MRMADAAKSSPARSAYLAPASCAAALPCNIYLHRLDRVWDGDRHGVLVRCDDLVVMCATRLQRT
jgi:hypothetical protein